jgi:Raf kinase inhibitor-like YbhB/YbcL family protein
MKNASWTIKVLYSTVFFSALGCSSATPTAPVTRTQTQAPATASGDAAVGKDASQEQKKTVETPKPAEKPADTTPPASTPATPQPLTLSSTAFANMGMIPLAHVAAGRGGMNMSPPLQWKNAPAGTGSWAIQMVDLDFQNPPLIHWMITNIPVSSTQLPAGVPGGNNLATPAEAMGASQTRNYAGPNPPNLHRYEWTIYAIKQGETLNLTNNSATNKTELEAKSLGKSVLVGTFAP